MLFHEGPISGVAAHGRKFIATAGYDNKLVLWDAQTRLPVKRVLHDHLVNYCAFSTCGQFLVSASSDYSARIWEIPSLRLSAVLVEHDDDVEAAAISDNGKRVATASRDTMVRIFSIEGDLVLTLAGHEADVISVAWSEQDAVLVSSGDDGTVRRWSASSGELLETIDLQGVETDTIALGKHSEIFAGNDNGEIVRITSSRTENTHAHDAGIKRLALNSDGTRLVSLSYDKSMAIWSLENNQLSKRTKTAVPSIVWPRSCCFINDKEIALGTFGDRYAIYSETEEDWDTSTILNYRNANAVLEFRGSVLSVGDSGEVFADGQCVAKLGSLCNFLVSAAGRIYSGGQLGVIFDAETGEELYRHRSPLNCATSCHIAGSDLLIFGTYTGEALVFNATGSGLDYVESVALHDNAVKGITNDGSVAFSVSACGAAAFLSLDKLRVAQVIRGAHSKIANACDTLGREKFVSVSRDRAMRLWRGSTFEKISTPHENSIKSVAVSHNKKFICSCDYGGSSSIYDVEKNDWLLHRKLSGCGLSSVTACKSRLGFLISSYDGTIHELEIP